MRGRSAAIVAFVGAACSACSLLVDMKYLGGSEPAGGAGDAAALDAARTTDAGAGGDSATDGGVPNGTGDGDAGPTGGNKPYCDGIAGAMGLAFCSDFDSADFSVGWSGKDSPPNACTLSGTALFAVSAPRALSAKVTARGSDCSLFYSHPPIKISAQVEADVRLEDFIDKGSSVYPISLYQTPSFRAVSIQATASGWNAIDVPAGALMSRQLSSQYVGSTSSSGWHHVSVTITLSTMGQPTVTAMVDGIFIAKGEPLNAAFSAGDTWEIYAGLTANDAVAQDYIDNVAIYMK